MVLGVALTLQHEFVCGCLSVCVCVCAQTVLTERDLVMCAAHPSELIQCQQNQGLLEYRRTRFLSTE